MAPVMHSPVLLSVGLVLLSIGLGRSSTLHLSGHDGRLQFGSDASTAATLSATCASRRPTFTRVKPTSFAGYQSGTVELLLGGVAPNCLAVADWRTTPCATLENEEAAPPLFWCRYFAAAGEVVVGPVVANTTAYAMGGVSFGYSVHATCPLPEYAALLALGPYDGSQASYPVNISVRFWAPSGPGALDFDFAGVPGGDVITFKGLPAPPPPAPPSAPPWQDATEYVQYGRGSCSDESSTTLYAGWVAGSHYSSEGGGFSTYPCMHPTPQYFTAISSPHSTMYGVEYERAPNSNFDAACSVCQRPAAMQTYVQWGRGSSCSNDHVTLYSGYAAAGGEGNAGRTEMVCVDHTHAGHASNDPANNNGGLFYPHKAIGGSADDGYVSNAGAVGCSVCAVLALTSS